MRLDFQVGDVVQINSFAKRCSGRLGVIIGSKYEKTVHGTGTILYTVKFNDCESIQVDGKKMKMVKESEETNEVCNS